MTINEYFTKRMSTNVKQNKTTSGYQCVDLVKDYCIYVLDIYDKCPSLRSSWAWGNAIDWYKNQNSISKTFFKAIKYTPTVKIKPGDVVIFYTSSAYGHIAIATGYDDSTNIITFDQNWGSKNAPCTFVKHKCRDIAGILRKKV